MAIATAAFLAAWLPSGRDAATLVKIELTDPSALTLYLATREVSTPASPPQFWQGAIADVGAVAEPGNLGAFDPGLATFDFTLSGRPLRGQGVDDSALDLLASYYWYGATVTAYWWETSLTAFSDALQIFKGVVIEQETESNQARIYCQQRNSWVVRVPAEEVTRAKYPRAPEKSLGLPIPICYGKLLTPDARPPAAAQGAYNQTLTGLLGLRRAGVRGVPVSLGKGDGVKGKVLFAGHECKVFNSDVAGSTPAVPFGDRLCEIDPAVGDDFSAADGTGFDFDDVTAADVDPFDCFFPVLSIDSKQIASNPGDNARGAINAFNDAAYARLDYDAGEREINFILGDVAPPGLFRRLQMVICWSTSPGATNLVAAFVSDTGGTSATLGATADLDSPTGSGTTISGGLPNGIWTLGGEGASIGIYFNGVSTGQKARIYAVGVIYKFRPQWPVATPSRTYIIGYKKVRKKKGLFFNPLNAADMYTTKPIYHTDPEEQIVDAQFHATLEGHPDTGGGTYTGDSLDPTIQRPPDILRHFLTTYCDETLFETASSNPGDLEDLRDALKTRINSDMVAAFAIDDSTMSSDVVRDLARSTMCWFFISCFDDKWCGIPWKAGRAVDFPRRLTRYDLMDEAGPKVILHRDEVVNDLRIGYGFDAWTRSTVHETRVGPDHSASGYKYRQLRDERISVVASESDRLDFTEYNGGAFTARTASLTPDDYSGIEFAQHLQTQMRAVAADEVSVSYGYEVVANFNDDLDINDGAGKTVALTAGTYTGETLATHVAARLNSVSSLWSCAYSRSTQLFTIARSAGTAQLLFQTGANMLTSCAALLGYAMIDYTGFATYASGTETEEERFTLVTEFEIALDFETGANGIDAATPRTCGMLLGFDMARDTDSAAGIFAHTPKSTREHDCATSVARYGARPEASIDLTAVNDTDTAREARNRIIDLWSQPPVEIQFATERMPDLQKGMVFDFDATLDEVKPYPVPGSDGSWLGKEFVAVRVERRTFPTPHEFVVAFEVPAG